MLKKLAFVLAIGVFVVTSVSAQTKVDKYLGTWKMVSQPKGWKIKMITLNVSVADEALKVEKITDNVRDGKADSSTVIYSYKLSGGTSTSLPFQNSFASTYLRYLSDDNLRLVYTFQLNNANQEPLQSDSSTREDWSLSSDGKTLTVDIRKYFNSSKFVYAKQ